MGVAEDGQLSRLALDFEADLGPALIDGRVACRQLEFDI